MLNTPNCITTFFCRKCMTWKKFTKPAAEILSNSSFLLLLRMSQTLEWNFICLNTVVLHWFRVTSFIHCYETLKLSTCFCKKDSIQELPKCIKLITFNLCHEEISFFHSQVKASYYSNRNYLTKALLNIRNGFFFLPLSLSLINTF